MGEVVNAKYKVTGTYDSGNIIFLNSSNSYYTDFTAVIFKDDEKYFQKRGIDPVEYYDQKTIQVTGELQKYDGPEIILYHPYQVEVLDNSSIMTTQTVFIVYINEKKGSFIVLFERVGKFSREN